MFSRPLSRLEVLVVQVAVLALVVLAVGLINKIDHLQSRIGILEYRLDQAQKRTARFERQFLSE